MTEFEQEMAYNYKTLKLSMVALREALARLEQEVTMETLSPHMVDVWTDGEAARLQALVSKRLQTHIAYSVAADLLGGGV